MCASPCASASAALAQDLLSDEAVNRSTGASARLFGSKRSKHSMSSLLDLSQTPRCPAPGQLVLFVGDDVDRRSRSAVVPGAGVPQEPPEWHT
ncbi:hypothetical protein E2562_024070 [Oryza meyeriana var. granulata]|uniref:Uncharacterized protein n=1 Tax=Oryza meyeriana var. granulata TaxID=110450 RepID=A0A6G1CJF2_9ORYZ|nr:hypothetical protein E2562_024070 [Oryza meyeriana var. granulata]